MKCSKSYHEAQGQPVQLKCEAGGRDVREQISQQFDCMGSNVFPLVQNVKCSIVWEAAGKNKSC